MRVSGHASAGLAEVHCAGRAKHTCLFSKHQMKYVLALGASFFFFFMCVCVPFVYVCVWVISAWWLVYMKRSCAADSSLLRLTTRTHAIHFSPLMHMKKRHSCLCPKRGPMSASKHQSFCAEQAHKHTMNALPSSGGNVPLHVFQLKGRLDSNTMIESDDSIKTRAGIPVECAFEGAALKVSSHK
jgi:hypothetical protein